MRSVFSIAPRAAAVLMLIALLLVPAASADDSFIKPPQPQSVAVLANPQINPPHPHSVLWHTLFVILASSRILPFVS